jgi:hypothetical protein
VSAKLFLNVLLTGYPFLLKPLTKSESHGQISGYEVILWSPEENSQQTLTLPQSVYSLPINVTDRGSKVTVTVTARNPAGVSLPANVVIPRYLPGKNGGKRVVIPRHLPGKNGGGKGAEYSVSE